MNTDLKELISKYIRKYSETFQNKLGLTVDDLENDIREQVWKGLVTHDKTKKASVNTYVHTLIENRFKLLYRRSRIVKFNSIDYYANWTDSPNIDQSHLITDETGEDLVSKRESMAQVINVLNTLEDKSRQSILRRKHELAIYGFLMKGLSISEMQTKEFTRQQKGLTVKYVLPRMEVVRIIKKIHQLVMDNQEVA